MKLLRRSDILSSVHVGGQKLLASDSWSVTPTLTHTFADSVTSYGVLMSESLSLSFSGVITYPQGNDSPRACAMDSLAAEIQRVMYKDIVDRLTPILVAIKTRSIEKDDVVRQLASLLDDLTQ